jgi:hypothetical protein
VGEHLSSLCLYQLMWDLLLVFLRGRQNSLFIFLLKKKKNFTKYKRK